MSNLVGFCCLQLLSSMSEYSLHCCSLTCPAVRRSSKKDNPIVATVRPKKCQPLTSNVPARSAKGTQSQTIPQQQPRSVQITSDNNN